MEDFLAAGGRVSLFREEAPVRSDSSLLSSFYSYLLPGNDQSGKSLSPSEIKARKSAMKCIKVRTVDKLVQPSCLDLGKQRSFPKVCFPPHNYA